MRAKIKCPCGSYVTPNTFKCHIKSKKCNLDYDEKEHLIGILNKKTTNNIGWLKKEGLNAIGNPKWFLDVIEKRTNLEDWIFESPRPKGQTTPNHLKRLSENRKGSKNPISIAKMPNYDINVIKNRAKEIVAEILKSDSCGIGRTIHILRLEFPNFMFLFSDNIYSHDGRGFNDVNHVFANLLDITIEDLVKISAMQRGKIIRKSLLVSDKFKIAASKTGSECLSKFRVTKPQIKLFELIKEKYDKDAELEKKACFDGIYRSFDIFSPKINAFIEMHGRVWHDPEKTKEKLMDLCKKNVKNDLLKKSIAEFLNKSYIVFWDDESEFWDKQLREIYEDKICKND